MAETIKILFVGDIVGRPGRRAVMELLPGLIEAHSPELVVANGENAAGGFGITPDKARELLGCGIDVLTSGNHIWDRRDIYSYLDDGSRLIRPANYPEGAPGRGWITVEGRTGVKVGVVNLSGRVFMNDLDCPFRVGDRVMEAATRETPIVLIDMHAETTSEKAAMGWYFAGVATAVIGTHTHVQTSDERVLHGGTAFMTDAGMTGPTESIIGMRKDEVLERFLTQMPARFEVATKGVELQGALVTAGVSDGKAVSIERIKERLR